MPPATLTISILEIAPGSLLLLSLIDAIEHFVLPSSSIMGEPLKAQQELAKLKLSKIWQRLWLASALYSTVLTVWITRLWANFSKV